VAGGRKGRKAAPERANDGAARSTLLWTAERYDQLAEIAERFRGPGKLLELDRKARGRQRAIANVGKSDCERSFARATGDDQVAPRVAFGEEI
jgi:hypothetical protein